MAVFRTYTARPGNGKSLQLARITLELLERNERIFKKLGIRRKIASNMRYNETLYQHYPDGFEEFEHDVIDEKGVATQVKKKYWSTWEHLFSMKDCDIIWDEISILMDSRKFDGMSQDQAFFLAHYRRLGLDIYGATQNWSMVDRRARLMHSSVYGVTKIAGSGDPSPTRPKIKNVWGVIGIFSMQNFESEESTTEPQFSYFPPADVFFIKKKLIDIYDTTELIKPSAPPLQHLTRKCLVCGKVHTTHK